MIPRNQQNRKARIDLRCPTCGMDLTDPSTRGFTSDGDTYCCEGCATGTGCTCEKPAARSQNGRGAPPVRQRKTASRYPSRKADTRRTPKRKRNLHKPRDSTREQSRGRSEFTGENNRGGATRVATKEIL